jgi:hypothetical protein
MTLYSLSTALLIRLTLDLGITHDVCMTTVLQTVTYFNVKTKVCLHDICVTTTLTRVMDHYPNMYRLESFELHAIGIMWTNSMTARFANDQCCMTTCKLIGQL